MKLREWIEENNMTQRQFASEIGFTRSHLNLVMSGAKKGGVRFARAIESRTDGDVSWIDILTGKAIG